MKLRETTRHAVLAFALLLSSASAYADMALHVTPKNRLFTDPAYVTVSGAPPGAEVTIEATLTDRGGQAWTSRGVFYADLSGEIDRSRDASVFGTYKGIDGEAIFWSMQPATSEPHFNYPGRPASLMSIPLEYFRDALAWFADRYGQKSVDFIKHHESAED